MSTGPFVSKVTSKSNMEILKEICVHNVPLCPLTSRGVKVLLRPSELRFPCRNCSMKSQQCYVNAM